MVRTRSDPGTQAYEARRTSQGLSTKEIRRCLKSYIVRERYPLILADPGPIAASSRHRSVNARAETINGLYESEMVHHQGLWKTKESLELPTAQWVHWFNHQRLLGSIGHISPAEAEANYYLQFAQQTPIAA